MGLIAWAKRLHYRWSWRWNYWWLDTPGGERAHWACVYAGALVAVIQVARMMAVAVMPLPAGEPRKSVYWWVVQLIIAVVAAAVSYSMRPKVQQPTPAAANAPTTQDGQTVKHYWGTHWIEDEFLLAWKLMGTSPIKTKGGKK